MTENNTSNAKKEYRNFLVTDEILLYKLADAGLLSSLARVALNKYVDGARIWYFDKTDDVKSVIDEFRRENADKSM